MVFLKFIIRDFLKFTYSSKCVWWEIRVDSKKYREKNTGAEPADRRINWTKIRTIRPTWMEGAVIEMNSIKSDGWPMDCFSIRWDGTK